MDAFNISDEQKRQQKRYLLVTEIKKNHKEMIEILY